MAIVALLLAGCGVQVPVAAQAEASYGAELQACVAAAKVKGGRAASKACEADVDARWGVTTTVTDGGAE